MIEEHERWMVEHNRKMIMNLADIIKGEVNRICVTDDLLELNNMRSFAIDHINRLCAMREPELTIPEFVDR